MKVISTMVLRTDPFVKYMKVISTLVFVKYMKVISDWSFFPSDHPDDKIQGNSQVV
jgi:hypothetical protein